MNRTLKVLLAIAVLVPIVISYRIFVFPYLLKRELSKVVASDYFERHQGAMYCFSDKRHDGSEIIISQIDDKKLREYLEETTKLVRLHVGEESRIWIYVDSCDLQNIKVEINTAEEWKRSFFYYGDYHVKFANKEIVEVG